MTLADLFYVAGGGGAGLLLNLTANKLPEKYHASFLKWGWFAITIYFTVLLMSIDAIEKRIWSIGRGAAISYLIAGVLGTAVGLTYWFVVNHIYASMTESEAAPPKTATQSTSQATPTAKPTPDAARPGDVSGGVLWMGAQFRTKF